MVVVKDDFSKFIKHLKFEALALAALMLALAYHSPYSMWWLLLGFPLIDIGMIGYVVNSKVGAATYNLTHNATLPTLFIAIGVIAQNELLAFIGVVWTFHISVDRLLGYGLKQKHSFNYTHLGKIGKK